jgi:hypothetical protein
MMLRYAPALAALLYPLTLLALHQSGQQFLQAPDTAGRLGAGLLLCVAVALVYGVPIMSLAVILKSGRDVLARRLAHLAFAAPPLFVLIGVLFYMLEVPNADYVAWGIGWCGVLGFAAFAGPGKEVDQNRARIFSHRDCRDLPGLAPRQSRDRRL